MTDSDRILVTVVLVVALFGVISWAMRRHIVPVFLAPKGKRDTLAWERNTEDLLEEYLRVCLRKATLETALAEELPKMPAAFVHPVEEGIQLGHAFERELRRRASELGVLPLLPVTAPAAGGAPVIPLEPTPKGQLVWRGGKLVPRGSR